MSVALRIIPCLDVNAGRVVKGVNFQNLRDAGDPVELAKRYGAEGADEITFLDVSALEWAMDAERRGVGEILLNSMDADGVKQGFDIELLNLVKERVHVPIIASGGAGTVEHFVEAARAGSDAILAASVFHFGEVAIRDVKMALDQAGFPVRM